MARATTPDHAPKPEPRRGGVTITIPPAAPGGAATAPDQGAPDADGIFYLLERVAFKGQHGIRGYPPGTEVRQLVPGTYAIDGLTAEIARDRLAGTADEANRIFAERAAAIRRATQQMVHPQPAQPPAPTPVQAQAHLQTRAQVPALAPAEVGPGAPADLPPVPAPLLPMQTAPAPPIAAMPGSPAPAPGAPAAAAAAAPPGAAAAPGEKPFIRTYRTKTGQVYHVKVRGGEVKE